MKVLITGCNGQVGRCLVDQFDLSPDVLALDRSQLDITNKSAVDKLVDAFKPAVIINAAAYTAVDKAEDEIDLSYAINRDGPKLLAEAAERNNALIMHISTDYVFSGSKKGAYSEADTTSPQGIYGESKLAGEKAVIKACSRHIIIRTAWVFGEHGNNFVKTMLRLGKDRDELGIVGDQFGGPTYAGDIASALVTIAKIIFNGENDKFGIYHFSGMPYVSWYEFADVIFKKALDKGKLAKVPTINCIGTKDFAVKAKRPANSRLDCALIKDKFNIVTSEWCKGLELVVKSYNE